MAWTVYLPGASTRTKRSSPSLKEYSSPGLDGELAVECGLGLAHRELVVVGKVEEAIRGRARLEGEAVDAIVGQLEAIGRVAFVRDRDHEGDLASGEIDAFIEESDR